MKLSSSGKMGQGLRDVTKKFYSPQEYLPVSQLGDIFDSCENNRTDHLNVSKNYPLKFAYFLLCLWTIALGLSTWVLYGFWDPLHKNKLQLYSPLEHLVEYEHRTFNQGLWNESTVYMGSPRRENTHAWEELVEHGMIKMDATQEQKLFNRSVAILDDPEYFVGAIEMFHQLHCLNIIRNNIWAEQPITFFGRENQGIEEVEHMDHCIDYLRQVLMCHGDIGIITFRYSRNGINYQPNFNITRTCKKFEPLMRWSDAHQAGNATPDGSVND